ncbi:MAG: M20/M25/M40 family metallo-hydrolase [Sphingomonadaceae bacterium]|nr:M20/M25/M40 family metallo-hydrolase [Sphingomonadaceae bacterium]
MRPQIAALAALTTAPAIAAQPAQQRDIAAAAAQVSEAELRRTIETLVGFGTRHTLSTRTDPRRGIGAASKWAEERLKAIGAGCGGCIEVRVASDTFTGRRIPTPSRVQAILGVQRGTTDPERVIVISGHIDSRNSNELDADGIAPGANDDGSGTAAVIEAARVLSKLNFAATIVYAVLEGEEQGLYGGKVAAAYAKAQGWRVEADLNNDIVGNTRGQGGQVDDRSVRVFSEGTKTLETPAEAARRRYNGGEVDSPSRQIARYLAETAEIYTPGFRVRMIYRTDRFGRGGDQTEFLNAGFPAVRITEGAENYDRQHQDVRTEGGRAYGDVIAGVDFPYLARVTRLNVAAAARMARAPAPPGGVEVSGAVSADTTLKWQPVPGAASYRVWWRDTVSPRWQQSRETAEPRLTLKGVVIDDFMFGVSSVAADGSESPVVFPGPAGAFFPEPAGMPPPAAPGAHGAPR